jgi:pentatricopeptide repeat protein
VFDGMPPQAADVRVRTSLMSAYAKAGDLQKVVLLFRQMQVLRGQSRCTCCFLCPQVRCQFGQPYERGDSWITLRSWVSVKHARLQML